MKMRKIAFGLLIILSFGFVSCEMNKTHVISLAGTWELKLEPQDTATQNAMKGYPSLGKIKLPGTTDENGFGIKTTDTAYGILSREYEYIGLAHYSRRIKIPSDWADKEVVLFLERVLWESKVYIDGKEKSVQDALGTPHIHNLGILEPGSHVISIRVDNEMIHNIGDKGHAYGEYMQSIWNGIVGRIELRAVNRTHIEQVRLFPDIDDKSLNVEMNISKPEKEVLEYVLRIREKGTRKIIFEETHSTSSEHININLKPEEEIRLWSEFDPFMYEFEVLIDPIERFDFQIHDFGFIETSKTDHHILVNNEKVFLRGNLDCIHFPLTGYPAMKAGEWEKIFRTYKKYGLNHVRFHSWCPPEAAFVAADKVGIYIQTEASVWIDWWMGTDMVARGRPEMDTKGKPQGIGKGDKDADDFIRAEMQRVVDTYGNHPSFIMFCIGNELGSSDFEVLGEWIADLKKYDPRRLYAASTARTITEFCDYSATHNVPGVGGVRQRMYNNLNWDYESTYRKNSVPIIAHEIGQWPVYPDWDEIKKYDGVLKPRNLEELEDLAIQTGLWDQNEELHKASGKLSAILYKDEIESFLRTPSCAGYQLLSMQDYIGQGEAVIGWLDSFYESKGNLEPETARQYMNSVVPLIKLPSYIWSGGEKINTTLLLHNFGPADLQNQSISIFLEDREGKVYFEEVLGGRDYKKGELHVAEDLSIPVPDKSTADSYTIRIKLNGTTYQNTWPIWVYPNILPDPGNDVIITEVLDTRTAERLEEGARVLLISSGLGDPDNIIRAAFKPLYWSASFFPGQSIETLGSIVRQTHPALNEFPTEDFASWNFWELCRDARAFNLKDAPADLLPIIQPVSDFHFSKRLGSLIEAKVGKGKIMISGYDISDNKMDYPEIRQFRYSLLKYMNSDSFDPDTELDISYLNELFPRFDEVVSRAPAGFEDASLFVEAAENQKEEGNSEWSSDIDEITFQKNTEYIVEADGCWKDSFETAWFGKKIQITIKVPDGSIGEVLLFVHDWNNLDRDGIVEIENRKYSIGEHGGKGKWINLEFMREDTQDGELEINIKSSQGPNIMLTRMGVFNY